METTPTTKHNNHSKVVSIISLFVALKNLPPDFNNANTLNFIEDLSHGEIHNYELFDDTEIGELLDKEYPEPDETNINLAFGMFVDYLVTNVLPIAKEALLKETESDQEPEIS